MMIHGEIDQKEKVSLLLDTGSGGLSISGKDWRPQIESDLMMIGLGKDQIRNASLAVFQQFSAGNFEMKNAVAAIAPDGLSGMDGIAGAIVFSDYLIFLPLKQHKDLQLFSSLGNDYVSELKKRGLHFSSAVTLPFYRVNKMIIVKGKIKKSDNEMDFLVDTGAQASVLSTAVAKEFVHIDYQKTHQNRRQNLMGLGGRVEDVLVTDNVEIQVGPLKKYYSRMLATNLRDISESLELELDFILGQDFLKDYALLIDYRNNKITFLQ